ALGPIRGLEQLELAIDGWALGRYHDDRWIVGNFPGEEKGYYRLFTRRGLNEQGGGDTGAPQVAWNPIPREHYHTDWVAERTIAWLDPLADGDPWFVCMSSPD